MTALGIDIGSTSIKGAVLAGDSRHGTIAGLVEKVAFPGPVAGLPPGHFEVEPSLVLDATREVLGNLLRRAPTVSRLYLCGQMGGAVVCSGGGLPLCRYHSWRDQRTTQDNGAFGSLLQVVEKRLAPPRFCCMRWRWMVAFLRVECRPPWPILLPGHCAAWHRASIPPWQSV